MTEVDNCFSNPSYRLQLLVLLNQYTSHDAFPACAASLATHSLLSTLLSSLMLDTCPTAFTTAVTVFSKLLPVLAVKACAALKAIVPKLLVILARIICWKAKPPAGAIQRGDDLSADTGIIQDPELEFSPSIQVRPELKWKRLEASLDVQMQPAVVPTAFFSILYFLFPCTVIMFLRAPFAYFKANDLECPFIVPWEDVLDEDELRSKSEVSTNLACFLRRLYPRPVSSTRSHLSPLDCLAEL